MNKITGGEALIGAGLQLGSGDIIKKLDYGTIAINPGSIAADTRLGVTFTLTGAADGDAVIMVPPAALHDDLVYNGARVTAANTVTVYLYNPTGSAIDDASTTWGFLYFDMK